MTVNFLSLKWKLLFFVYIWFYKVLKPFEVLQNFNFKFFSLCHILLIFFLKLWKLWNIVLSSFYLLFLYLKKNRMCENSFIRQHRYTWSLLLEAGISQLNRGGIQCIIIFSYIVNFDAHHNGKLLCIRLNSFQMTYVIHGRKRNI